MKQIQVITKFICYMLFILCTMTDTLNALCLSSFIPRTCVCSRTFAVTNNAITLRKRKPEITMGLEIKIRIVGRQNGSEKWLQDAYEMYETRLRPSNIGLDTIWHKNDDDLIKGIRTDEKKGHSVVLLDPTGDTKTSERFSSDMYQWLNDGGSRLVFVIGGAEGLPSELKYGSFPGGKGGKGGGSNSSLKLLSLSSLTFTHQFARTLLVEQIYRASEIRKGSGYHK